MIRYKDKMFEQWSICPATGEIFDAKTGEVQQTYMQCPWDDDYLKFKGMPVHSIMAHTFYGFKPCYDVHHLDENKHNNVLSNLAYVTHSEHMKRFHAKRGPYKSREDNFKKATGLTTHTTYAGNKVIDDLVKAVKDRMKNLYSIDVKSTSVLEMALKDYVKSFKD